MLSIVLSLFDYYFFIFYAKIVKKNHEKIIIKIKAPDPN